MTEILTINTEQNIIKHDLIEPLTVYTEGFESLNQRISEYTGKLPDTKISKIIDQLKVTMKKYNGMGLAANQCNINLRLFILGSENFQFVCINPKILRCSDKMIRDKEGCLSYPALFLSKERPETIEVEFLTEQGELKQVEFSGLTARIFCHELDHLDGKLFTDSIGKTSMLLARQKQQKLIKKFSRIVKNKY